VELETPLKTDDVKRMIREQIREQLGQSLQDMEEIRRSPAASIIRIEEEIKSIKQVMVTKEEFKTLEGSVKGLEGRFIGLEGKFSGLEGKVNLIIGLIFTLITLYGALVVKFIFFP